MWLLYIDESGEFTQDRDHFVVAGLAVREGEIERTRTLLEVIFQSHVRQDLSSAELHAQHIRSGKGVWRSVPKDARYDLLQSVSNLLGSDDATEITHRLFGVVRSPEAVPDVDPLERVFEELLLRFDQMLVRQGKAENGIVVADRSKYESIVQPLTRRWRREGTRFRRLSRVVEVPLFIDSQATRMIQLADCIAHAIYRYYSVKDETYLQPMLPTFDSVSGKMHGLVHLAPQYKTCSCYACVSRR